MKKLLVLCLALLVSSVLTAQGSRTIMTKKSFLAFHAGPSFPMGDFSSSNPANDEAGLAKTGFTTGINYGYRINEGLGVEAAIFYNQYATKDVKMVIDMGDGTETLNMSADAWKLYGLTLGPSLNFSPGKNMRAGIHVMGGFTSARAPAFYMDNELVTKADWGIGPVIQAGLNLKIDAGKQVFVFIAGDYQYMRPEFNLINIWTDESDKAYQKISVLQATAGIGFRF